MPQSSLPCPDADTAVGIAPRTVRGRRALPYYWQCFTLVLAAAAIAGGLVVLLVPDLSGLYLLALYSGPSNSLIPIPHEPGLLYFAKYYEPALIAVAATAGTCAIAYVDYDLVKRAFAHPRLAGVKHSRWFETGARLIHRSPVWTVALFAATPLPIMVVRVLAPASGVPISRYLLGLAIGRLPRYYAFAWLGRVLAVPNWALALALLVLIAATWWMSRQPRREVPQP